MTERIDEFSFVFNAVSLESCGSRRASYPDRSNIVPGRAINLRVNRAAFQGGTSVLLMQAGHNGALPVFLWRRRGRLPALPLLPVRARPLRFFLTARRTEPPARPSRVCRRARPVETPRTYPQNAGQRPHLSGGWYVRPQWNAGGFTVPPMRFRTVRPAFFSIARHAAPNIVAVSPQIVVPVHICRSGTADGRACRCGPRADLFPQPCLRRVKAAYGNIFIPQFCRVNSSFGLYRTGLRIRAFP